MNDMSYRYFIFSREQMEMMKEIRKNMNKNIKFGEVVVNGISKPYTDIVTDMSKCKFGDSVLVIAGDLRKLKYTQPKTY